MKNVSLNKQSENIKYQTEFLLIQKKNCNFGNNIILKQSYMKHFQLPLHFLLAFVLFSCIQDEAPNTEADIESVSLPGNVLVRSVELDAITDGTDGKIYPIILYVKKGTDASQLAPEFTLTPGATIMPPSGTVLNFNSPQTYIVTSEDGEWQRKYRIEVTSTGFTSTQYDFEHARLGGNGKYHIFYETDQMGVETMTWASANPGFALTDYTITRPEEFPTYQSDEGRNGSKCVKLVTRKTGSLGSSVNMPIASGNLFIGSFNLANALTNALKATQFGIQFDQVPTSLHGYYKFKAGDTFYELDTTTEDKLKPLPGRKDIFNIYAVFFESTPEQPALDGTNVLAEDNEQIISVAQITDAKETDEWTEFDLPFNVREGKSIDATKLAEGKYYLTIVFASSIRGDYFEGAPGSTLYIDEVTLNYEQ